MSADLVAKLGALKISATTVDHAAVSNPGAWAEAVSSSAGVPAKYLLTKTLVLKPKTAKTAVPTPVMIVALETTDTPLGAIGKSLGLKECRLANEDLLASAFGGVNKDQLSPFALSGAADLKSVILVVDSKLFEVTEPLAFHAQAENSTVFVSAADLKAYFAAIGVEPKVEDLSALASASPAPAAAATPAAGMAKKVSEKAASPEPSEELSGAAQLGMTVGKLEDFPKWYTQVITKSEMIDYYDVSGCYIIRPWAHHVWDCVREWFGKEIKKLGVEDAYFPMFVSSKVLEKEKDHIEGFAPEVAWVTKAGSGDLEEPLAIRPTSETVMYPYYAKWIRSHRNLPLRLNQWCNVVRWEFKHPQPFIRTREFLWQEGHTAHLTLDGAAKEVRDILALYRRVYTDLLALPVVEGQKSEKEKFAGGYYTTTVEAFIPATGRGLQGGTSHCLGQNFSKMFNIVVEDPNAPATADGAAGKLHVWQNSWGLSTRVIGAMVMVHGDDKGLVMPPRVSQIQVVIVPVGLTVKTTPEESKRVIDAVAELEQTLDAAGIRVHADTRENYSPGFKFSHWELKGVPVRLEVGPKDLAKNSALGVIRHNGTRAPLSLDNIGATVKTLLDTIHHDMLAKATKERLEHTVTVENWKDFVPALNGKNIVLMPWCEQEKCEDSIKERSSRNDSNPDEQQDEKAPSMGAKSLCIPFEQPTERPIVPGVTKCVACGADAKSYTLFGRSY
ncbi:prolyl-tRNA synthetase [Ramicandelaber brevisporus]|nr:prolyl-tRNA synthetase [Ramicandelaber brevisporus]